MTGGGYNLVAAWRSLALSWHEFFHRPRDTRVCALIRITYAALVLIHWAVLYPDLELWYGENGVLPGGVSREVAEAYQWSLLWHLPATPAALNACFWIAVSHTVMLGVGLLPRINAACLLVWLISFQNRNGFILDGEDTTMRLLALYLVLMPCGASWSANSLLWRWWNGIQTEKADRLGATAGLPSSAAGHLQPAWGLRLLQIQMAVIFLTAGLAKIGDADWLGGTAMYYVARLDDYFGRFPTPTWLFDQPWSVALATWSVILGELLVPVFIWFRQTRRWALVAAILFHLANEWTMHLFLFHWLMLAGWLSFLEPSEIGGRRSEVGGQQ
ncbi:MAG: HTTM domain-containing protein [Planctomycetaceae bacterium]|nr:HTTM domain-containing protein [Planctomycetaceae bacterium]